MKVKDLKEKLSKLPDDLDIKYVDRESWRLRDYDVDVELGAVDDKDRISFTDNSVSCVIFFT